MTSGIAAFSGRRGGVSTGRFAEANISTRLGDDPAAVLENRRRLLRGIGLAGRLVVTVDQGHTGVVVEIGRADIVGPEPELCAVPVLADGMLTRECGVALLVGVADCVPVALLAPADGVVGVVHAGHRGISAGIVQCGVRAMRAAGARAVRAVVGPAIGPCCYPVDEELRGSFTDRYPGAAAWTWTGDPAVDLRAAVDAGLREACVAEVIHLGGCTAHQRGRYFSARRDGVTGCQAGLAAIEPVDNSRGR